MLMFTFFKYVAKFPLVRELSKNNYSARFDTALETTQRDINLAFNCSVDLHAMVKVFEEERTDRMTAQKATGVLLKQPLQTNILS